ncbi:MAG: helix-turn-helix transcriptional regulator [Oscillospiraceae bacterium]|nr:helix-turn-helix transcriptional regulator [Oscillospiraceae bacterium]
MKERVFYEEFASLYYYHGSSQNWKMKGYHFHKNYEILLFMSEGAGVNIENRFYTVKPGDLVLVNNKEYHQTYGAIEGEYYRYVLMFDPEVLARAGTATGYEFAKYFEHRPENFMHRISLTGENLDKVIAGFENIERCIHEDNAELKTVKTELMILNLVLQINELYDFFLKSGAVDTQTPFVPDMQFGEDARSRSRIEDIKAYIVEHVSEKLELDDLATRFFMDKYYLSHYFKNETGFTLTQYITNQKIISAKSMLKRGCSVTEVALSLSFCSDSRFVSVFKKVTGITPKKYAAEKAADAKNRN